MKASEIKPNLNKIVSKDGTRYLLTAGIIRKDNNGREYYTVELTSLKARSVCIEHPNKVQLVEGGEMSNV